MGNKKLVKKVFPLVPGTEVAIRYKNNFGNTVAVNINSEKGLAVDSLKGDLEVQVLRAIRAGTLVIKEVEVVEKKVTKDAMLNELEKIAGLKSEKKATETKPAHHTEAPKETVAKPAETSVPATEVKAEHHIQGRKRGK